MKAKLRRYKFKKIVVCGCVVRVNADNAHKWEETDAARIRDDWKHNRVD